MRRGQKTDIEYTVFFCFVIVVVANWWLGNAKSPTAMNSSDATYASLRERFRPLRSLTCRTYVHTLGRVLSPPYFDVLYVYLVCDEIKSTARRSSSTTKTIKMKPEISGRKTTPRPLSCNDFLSSWNTLNQSKKRKNEQQSYTTPSVSFAAGPSQDHLATDPVRAIFSSLSATGNPVERPA